MVKHCLWKQKEQYNCLLLKEIPVLFSLFSHQGTDTYVQIGFFGVGEEVAKELTFPSHTIIYMEHEQGIYRFKK